MLMMNNKNIISYIFKFIFVFILLFLIGNIIFALFYISICYIIPIFELNTTIKIVIVIESIICIWDIFCTCDILYN
jgi:hypothetical protein